MPVRPRRAGPLAATLLLLVAGCAFDRTGPRPEATVGDGPAPWGRAGWYERSLAVGDTTRWYRLYFPPGRRRGAPVVVLLHGGSRSMRDMFGERSGGPGAWLDVARDEGIMLLVPNGTNPANGDTRGDNQFWNDMRPARDDDTAPGAADVRFVNAPVEHVQARYPLDPDRFYVSGASNGGLLTYTLLMRTPAPFAAGAAFIANLPLSAEHLQRPPRPTPLMIANGTDDRLMRWSGGELPFGGGHARRLTQRRGVAGRHGLRRPCAGSSA